MVILKKTEINSRKEGYKSIAKEYDNKLEKLNSDYNLTRKKLEDNINKKKKLIEKIINRLEELQGKEGSEAEALVLLECKIGFEKDIILYQTMQKGAITIPTVGCLLCSGGINVINKKISNLLK